VNVTNSFEFTPDTTFFVLMCLFACICLILGIAIICVCYFYRKNKKKLNEFIVYHQKENLRKNKGMNNGSFMISTMAYDDSKMDDSRTIK
jgi:hypothetical protein